MININVKDKYELQAIHKALMEAKFHPSPQQPIVQSSPMVANFMNTVVDELEKLNWVTDAEKKFRGIDYKNDWPAWRENPPESIVLPSIVASLSTLEELANESESGLLEFVKILLSPYRVSKERALEFIEAAKKHEI